MIRSSNEVRMNMCTSCDQPAILEMLPVAPDLIQ